MPNGPMKITGLALDEEFYESQYAVTDDNIKVQWRRQHIRHLTMTHVVLRLLTFVWQLMLSNNDNTSCLMTTLFNDNALCLMMTQAL